MVVRRVSDYEEMAYKEIRKLALKTNKQIKQLKKDTDRANPVDVDILKTTKAMFYERVIEIFKKYESKQEEN